MHNVKQTRKRSQASEMNTSNDNQNRFAGPYGPSVMARVNKFANVLTRMAVGKNRWSQTKPGGSREEVDSMACISNVSVLRSWQLSREVCYWFGTVNHDLWTIRQCCGLNFWSHRLVICVVFHVIQTTGISLGIEARDCHRVVKPVLRSTCRLRSLCSDFVSRCLTCFGDSQLHICDGQVDILRVSWVPEWVSAMSPDLSRWGSSECQLTWSNDRLGLGLQ